VAGTGQRSWQKKKEKQNYKPSLKRKTQGREIGGVWCEERKATNLSTPGKLSVGRSCDRPYGTEKKEKKGESVPPKMSERQHFFLGKVNLREAKKNGKKIKERENRGDMGEKKFW